MVAHPAYPVCAPDDDYDARAATDRSSRYGIYLRLHRHLFADIDVAIDDDLTADRCAFAAAAWSIAGPPIMTPGYVQAHPRVQSTAPHFDDDGRLAIAVELAIPAPPITARLVSPWYGWTCDYTVGQVQPPQDHERIVVLSRLEIRIPINSEALPAPRYRNGIAVVQTAKNAVRAICDVLDGELAGLLDALGEPR